MPNTESAANAVAGRKTDKPTILLPKSRSSTPARKPGTQASTMVKNNELDSTFKSDLANIQVLVTCSICDQLLYEPWTIACGHTYCYSCLCSWFGQDRRNKSCPECRSRVEAMPAPSFLIKQLVDVVLKSSESTNTNESTEQRQQKKLEEIALVDKDRNSSCGLFQGMFANRLNKLLRDDYDGGVMRCPSCGFEHEGGPRCNYCGEQLDEGDTYDSDEIDIESTEFESMGFALGYDSDDESIDLTDRHYEDYNNGLDGYVARAEQFSASYGPHQYLNGRRIRQTNSSDETESEITEASADSASSEIDADYDDEDNSIHDFIVPDEEIDIDDDATTSPRSPDPGRYNHLTDPPQSNSITITDDESDEGGAISSRRQRRRCNNPRVTNLDTTSPVTPVATLIDISNIESDNGDHDNEAESVSFAGWSPLELGNDSEEDRQTPSQYSRGNNNTSTETMNDGYDKNNDSDIEINNSDGNSVSDEYSPLPDYSFFALSKRDGSESSVSETSTYRAPDHHSDHSMYACLSRNDSDSNDSHLMDEDGDTDMNVSPRVSRNSRIVSTSYSSSHVSSADVLPSSASQKSSSSSSSTGHGFGNTRIRRRQNTLLGSRDLSGRVTSRGGNRTRRRRTTQGRSLHHVAESASHHNRTSASSTMQHPHPEESSQKSIACLITAGSLIAPHSGMHSNFLGERLDELGKVSELDEESDNSIQPPSRRRLE